MARIRTIKPEFWIDEKIAPLAPIHRLVFLGLISQADDGGRLPDNIRLLDGLIFPESDESSRESIEILCRLKRVSRYRSESGQKLLQIVNWEKHQKVVNPSKYTLPPMPDQPVEPEQVTESYIDSKENLNRSSIDPMFPILDHGPTTNDLGSRINTNGSFFDEAWKMYPKREGSNPKKPAYRAWKARVKEGIPERDLFEATMRYRAFCQRKGTMGSPFVMQAQTFWGPNERWKEDYTPDPLSEADRKLLQHRAELEDVDLENDFR